MVSRISRRRVLQAGSAVVGASALGLPRVAFAADRVVVRNDRDLQNLDPANRVGSVEGNILRNVYRKLVQNKPESLDWELDAAASISQPTPTRIEFTLKPGIMFQDGFGEMTADDVKFSYERFNPTNGEAAAYAADWAALEAVEVTGKYSGILHLKAPAPALWVITLPESSGVIVSRRAFEQLGDQMLTRAIGSGPYRLDEWTPNQRAVLRPDPDYLGPSPAITEVVLRPIQDPKTTELAYLANEVDFTKIEPTSAKEMAKATDGRVLNRDSINYIWIGINVEKAPFTDPRVRQAIRKAIDVDQVVLAGWDGTVGRAKSLLAPGLLGSWDDAPTHNRDITGAKRLLAEAGFANGFKTRLTLLNKAAFQTAGLVVQSHLADVGIDLELEVLDGGTYWSMGKGEAGENLDLSMQRFGGKVDPSFQTQWFVSAQTGTWNWQRWQNAEFDSLNDKAGSSTDNAERGRAYVRMQQLMDESGAFIWLTHEANVFAVKNWLKPAILPSGDDWQYRYFAEA